MTSRIFSGSILKAMIEGAHSGAGLGDRFLGHVERCGAILHLVDGTADDVVANWRIVRGEMDAYGNGLENKVEIVGLNKVDALTAETVSEKHSQLTAAGARNVMDLSGVTGEGVTDILRALLGHIRIARREAAPEQPLAYQP